VLHYPEIDPVILHLGPLSIRWYGLMYIAGFLSGYLLVRKQINEKWHSKREKYDHQALDLELQHTDGLLFYVIAGVIIGGRIGYVLFYNLEWFLHNPAEIIATWHGGMSFHGGAAGAILAGWLYCHKHRLNFLMWSDRFIITAPVGLFFGRLGNFINGELFGRPSNVPWAMIFPEGGTIPRHPSQLYEAFLEGILLFSILWPLRHRSLPNGFLTGLFLILYGICRIFAEFFREPDRQLGFIFAGWVTMGQCLSLVLIVAGIILCIYVKRYDRAS
jgi:phosphatidylglycerol:prolipoprotein diacylglycerol transferase